jgi:group II intron reverse transcriptase/maturase
MRFTSLMGLVFREEGLRASFGHLAAKKAPGVDGIRKEDYGADLESNLRDLSARIRRLGYRPKPSRRVYIAKSNGGRRPLGIPSFEDRIVQDRVSRVLQAIWEPEFRSCSYGFRPARSAHDALARVAKIITHGRVGYVVEADIKSFFTSVDHGHMMRFLAHRIGDVRFLRLIRRFLEAGILEDGAFAETERGTPQGGLVSPVLSNIYLHYVLDWWFEGRYARQCRGEAHIVRYADDFVACFQYRQDAERFLVALDERLRSFGLEVEPTKTHLHCFGRFAQNLCRQDGLARPGTFSFLGFLHYVGRSRSGQFVVGRRTERQRLAKKLKELNTRVRAMRLAGGVVMTEYLRRHLQGHYQYYGVSGNGSALREYYRRASAILLKWLNRRSQRRSLTWRRFYNLLDAGLLPKPHIVRNLYPVPTRMT